MGSNLRDLSKISCFVWIWKVTNGKKLSRIRGFSFYFTSSLNLFLFSDLALDSQLGFNWSLWIILVSTHKLFRLRLKSPCSTKSGRWFTNSVETIFRSHGKNRPVAGRHRIPVYGRNHRILFSYFQPLQNVTPWSHKLKLTRLELSKCKSE